MSDRPKGPALLVDVDGVLNPTFKRVPPTGKTCKPPYCRCHRDWVKRRAFPNGVHYRLLLNPAHGAMLTALADAHGAELMWASYWEDYANFWIGPTLGLPKLDFVPIGVCESGGLGAWKARRVAAYLGARPFVWLEDEPDAAETLAGLDGLGEHLVVQVDERGGLTSEHLDRAAAWLDGLRARPA